ncbi:MAG: Sec-independent protein translocase protein TatA [Pseudomonadota bacterium]|jgi:sec-independent protein translocase protein TatA
MLSGISIWQLLIVLLIVIMIFGTKKLRGLGGDLGGAFSNFKKAMRDGEKEEESSPANTPSKPLEHKKAEGVDADFVQNKEQQKH